MSVRRKQVRDRCYGNTIIYNMADTAQLEREDSMLEAHRTSLLEVIEDKNRTLNKVNNDI